MFFVMIRVIYGGFSQTFISIVMLSCLPTIRLTYTWYLFEVHARKDVAPSLRRKAACARPRLAGRTIQRSPPEVHPATSFVIFSNILFIQQSRQVLGNHAESSLLIQQYRTCV